MRPRPPLTASIPIRPASGGFCAEGPGFYVWDEDPREVREMFRALARTPEVRAAPVPSVSEPDTGGS